MGVPDSCFSALVTSGDVTRNYVEAYSSEPLFHIGPDRDRCLFEGLNVQFAPAAKAAAIVCTGFFDEDNEVPEDYDGMLASFAARDVPMICANPDLVVERGSKLMPCSGLLAERYGALGQTVIQAGKPYRPIYEAAMRKLSKPLPQSELLAIGDGVDTDIGGASGQGIDSIYIASRVNMGEAVEARSFQQAAARPALCRTAFPPGRSPAPIGMVTWLRKVSVRLRALAGLPLLTFRWRGWSCQRRPRFTPSV